MSHNNKKIIIISYDIKVMMSFKEVMSSNLEEDYAIVLRVYRFGYNLQVNTLLRKHLTKSNEHLKLFKVHIQLSNIIYGIIGKLYQ